MQNYIMISMWPFPMTVYTYVLCPSLGICYSWITSHILGLIQLAIPLGVVYSRFTCQTLTDMGNNSELFFCYAVITAIVHSINFNLLNSWMKSTIGNDKFNY